MIRIIAQQLHTMNEDIGYSIACKHILLERTILARTMTAGLAGHQDKDVNDTVEKYI